MKFSSYSPNKFFLLLLFCIGLASCKQIATKANDSGTKSDQRLGSNFAEQYANECKKANVVLPHAISDSKYWSEHRTVDLKFTHFAAGSVDDGDLYIHEEENGGCLQLNGNYKGRTSVAFAICWSATGSVCFWEQSGKTRDELYGNFVISDSNDATPYSQVDNNCISCHRGNNPFVGHGDLGDPAFNNFPDVPFTQPIGPKEWFRSDWNTLQKGDDAYQCSGSCHAIPKLDINDGFCGLGIAMMQEGMMLGTKLKIKDAALAKSSPQTQNQQNPKAGPQLDAKTALQCQQYASFLKACGIRKLNPRYLGICPVPGK